MNNKQNNITSNSIRFQTSGNEEIQDNVFSPEISDRDLSKVDFGSSSEAEFGQNTISMIDDFIEEEILKRQRRKGFLRILFFCF